MSEMPPPPQPTLPERLQYATLRVVLALLLLLPYQTRVRLCGWGFAHIVAPLSGARRQMRLNLARSFPDLPPDAARRVIRAVPLNVGRTMIEICSGPAFLAHVATTPITGDGLTAFQQARAEGRGVILVSGHFGNYDVPRAVLAAQGLQVGGLYFPPKNPLIEARYHQLISVIGQPVFPRGRRGLAAMVKHLRAGQTVGMLIDWHMKHGAALRFFNRTATTALSAAELALKYDCLLIPAYGLRQPDGLSFRLIMEAPILHTTAEAMTQAANDSLEAMIRQHPDQWFWAQSRWKTDDKAIKRRAKAARRGEADEDL